MTTDRDESIKKLRTAFRERKLSLYLGAGVSVANGLPSWEQLVLAMYYSVMDRVKLRGWRPFANYLYAISEWQLQQSTEPLEITARKLRQFYDQQGESQEKFLQDLRETLYLPFIDDNGNELPGLTPGSLRGGNSTLNAVATLCEADSCKGSVSSVITYNYDQLLELALHRSNVSAQFESSKEETEGLSIAHVHGYVPLRDEVGSPASELVFTEEQYHQVARDAYSWSNLMQIRAMTSSVGLMIGLSLSDRNMRRLLDATAQSNVNMGNFVLLQQPSTESPPPSELDSIHYKALDYLDRFEASGIKSPENRRENVIRGSTRAGVKSSQGSWKGSDPSYQVEISGILEAVRSVDQEQQEYVLKELGVEPVWYSDHEDIPGIIDGIIGD